MQLYEHIGGGLQSDKRQVKRVHLSHCMQFAFTNSADAYPITAIGLSGLGCECNSTVKSKSSSHPIICHHL
eukprot:scaffold473838_cov34-Prasinocladus_malaysianus.AAC.1